MERDKLETNARIKVYGVGGGGGNAVNTMIESGLQGVEFVAANTDIQALSSNLSPVKVQLGKELTKGLGAGANPSTGQDAALEDKALIQEVLTGADMVFVTAGMGGGTGTGAAPVIAQVARELGALTVGVVTKPFTFEGKRRRLYAEKGIEELKNCVDTLITIPNQRLLSIAPPNMSMLDGFKLADEVLLNAVKGISDIINVPGRVNVDFADVKTTMMDMGMALMGIGTSGGSNRATEAARAAINSPLLEDIDIQGATGVLINITGSSEMTLHEISEASTLIQEAAHEEANIIFGAVIDENMGEEIRVTVIATGFDKPTGLAGDSQRYWGGAPQFQNPTGQSEVSPQSGYAPSQAPQPRPRMPHSPSPQNQWHERPSLNQENIYQQGQVLDKNSPSDLTKHVPQSQSGMETQRGGYQYPVPPRREYGIPPPPENPQNTFPSHPFSTQNSSHAFNNGRNGNGAQDPFPPPSYASQNHSENPKVDGLCIQEFENLAEMTLQMAETGESKPSESVSNERPIAGASADNKDSLDEETKQALKLAEDLSKVKMESDREDFETPTFLRRKEEKPTNS